MSRPPVIDFYEAAETPLLSEPGPVSPIFNQRQAEPTSYALGVQRLNYFMDHSDPGEPRGSYAGWITRLAWETMATRKNFGPAKNLLHALGSDLTLRDYEILLTRILGECPLRRRFWYLPSFLRFRRPEKYLLAHSGIPQEWLDEIERAVEDPAVALRLKGILRTSGASPLAMFRLHRLYLLLRNRDGLLDSKLAELGDGNFRLMGRNSLSMTGQSRAYLDDPTTASLIEQAEQLRPAWTREADIRSRAAHRRAILKKAIADHAGPGSLCPGDFIRAFRLLRDPFSLQIARAIENQDFDLEILIGDSFQDAVSRHYRRVLEQSPRNRTLDPETHDAVYFYSGLLGEKAVLSLRNPPLNTLAGAPPETVLFELMSSVVHEYQHHLDMRPGEAKTQPVMFRMELRAHAREFLWRAMHGSPGLLRKLLWDSPLGFALSFRDDFERDYSPAFRQNLTVSDERADRQPERRG